MSSSSVSFSFHLWCRVLFVLVVTFSVVYKSFGVNPDSVLLLSFKYSVFSDSLNVLESWSFNDESPCSWNGVTCASPGTGYSSSRVISLSLPNSQLQGYIPADLGLIEYLENLDLSNNSLNGSLPFSLFNATQLRFLDLSSNLISGELPEFMGGPYNLQFLNLSDNAMAGKLPTSLTTLQNLTVVSLRNNYFSDSLPGGFNYVQVLDLSSNRFNGSLPPDFGGNNLRYMNLSCNNISGEIPPGLSEKIPGNATIDLSFNNLTGKIPETSVFLNQERSSFSGNSDLCGEPTNNPCPIPSSQSSLPNGSAPTSPPAIAAMPKTIDSNHHSVPAGPGQGSKGLRPGTIIGIVFGDVAGIIILAVAFFYVYRVINKKNVESTLKKETSAAKDTLSLSSSSSSESKGFTRWSCLRNGGNDGEEDSDTSVSDTEEPQSGRKSLDNQRQQLHDHNKKGKLVTLDGDKELELETLLKASAYILGASGSGIMYKTVLEDGTTFAVRRIGESSVDRFRDFETQVRVIAKLVHPNLVRIRGFYWGVDEKLIIYDYAQNGSLANARYSKYFLLICFLLLLVMCAQIKR